MVAPKLRFQEFDGDWESKKLKDLTDILKCGVASTPKYVTEGGYPFLSAQNISRNGEMNYSKVNNISDDFYKKISKTKLLKGDILYSRVGASYGVAAIFDREEEYGVYVSLTHIRVNDTLNNIFLKQFLNSPKARIQAEQGVFQGGGVQNLNVGVVEEFNLTLPSKQEQTKIASFLSAVDEKISQLTQKHQLLSQYKQGMMQKLFSQQLRFKADDGSEFDEWEYYKLGELTTLITKGTTPTSLGGKFETSGINFIKIESLSSDGKFLLDKFAYIDEVTHNKLARSQLENEDILFSIAGALGRVAIISNDYLPANTNQALAIIRLRNKNIIRYIYYFLNSDYVKKIIETESVQLAQANFSLGQLSDLDIVLPCIEEQTKIANFLSSIDQKIEVVAQQIEQAKLWKKGLLQQMFV